MKKYLWCTPILSGKTQEITNEWTKNTFDLVDPEHRKQLEKMHDRSGLHDFNLWIQHTSQGDLLLFYWEVEDWDKLLSEFRTILSEGNPRAELVHKQFLDVLGLDLSKPNAIPEPEMISHNEFGKLPASQTVRVAIAWPILEDRVGARREFAESLTHENKGRLKRLSRHLGIISTSRGIVESESTKYYVIYQEVDMKTWDRYQTFMDGNYSKGNWAWDPLIEDTGLTREQVAPHIEWVLDQAPVSTRG